MPQVVLNRPRVVAIIRQLVAARVAQHVRMDGEVEARGAARASEDLPHGRIGQRSPAFGREYVGRRRVIALKAPEGAQLRAPDRVCGRYAVLEPGDVQEPCRRSS
jgi:hypothetical protein